jgi:REP element-mobilizing transposase RayT
MQLTQLGVIADILWYEIKNHARSIELGEFIVMPNHIHGILILKNEELKEIKNGNENVGIDNDMHTHVETKHALSLQPRNTQIEQTIGQQRFQNQGKNTISSIIGSYKSAVTKHANRLGFSFAWQLRFHDHIIRDAQSFENIQHYIVNNAVNWEKDKLFQNQQ